MFLWGLCLCVQFHVPATGNVNRKALSGVLSPEQDDGRDRARRCDVESGILKRMIDETRTSSSDSLGEVVKGCEVCAF